MEEDLLHDKENTNINVARHCNNNTDVGILCPGRIGNICTDPILIDNDIHNSNGEDKHRQSGDINKVYTEDEGSFFVGSITTDKKGENSKIVVENEIYKSHIDSNVYDCHVESADEDDESEERDIKTGQNNNNSNNIENNQIYNMTLGSQLHFSQ